jgi:hypothetical protein
MYALTITFADHKNNAFVELGGAAWKTVSNSLSNGTQFLQRPAAA